VRELMQRWAGSCLTGIARDRIVLLMTGSGHNGKGVLAETLAHVLGTYSHAVSQRFFQRRAGEQIPPHELAQLPGKRLIFGAELKPSLQFDVELVKGLTGGDTLLACHKYQAPFTFSPQCKPIVSANHRPKIEDQTASIWDRLRIIDFPNSFERGKNRDPELKNKLAEVASGILKWMVDGCAAWKRDGIGSALTVDLATDDERRAQDPLEPFFDGPAMCDPDARIESKELYDAFFNWTESEHWKKPWSRTRFGRALTERGFRQWRNGKSRGWIGIALRGDDGLARPTDRYNQQPIDFKTAATGGEY
jgi:putative DNA primase/helicase